MVPRHENISALSATCRFASTSSIVLTSALLNVIVPPTHELVAKFRLTPTESYQPRSTYASGMSGLMVITLLPVVDRVRPGQGVSIVES